MKIEEKDSTPRVVRVSGIPKGNVLRLAATAKRRIPFIPAMQLDDPYMRVGITPDGWRGIVNLRTGDLYPTPPEDEEAECIDVSANARVVIE